MLFSLQTVYNLYQLVLECRCVCDIHRVKTEMVERTQSIIHYLMPANIVSAIWVWADAFEVRFVGEAAIWVSSSDRTWKPRSLEVMVPNDKWMRALHSLRVNLPGEMSAPFQSDLYPMAEECRELMFSDGSVITLYQASRESMTATICGALFSHYQGWFNKTSVFRFNASLEDGQAAYTPDDDHPDCEFWKSLGWTITEDIVWLNWSDVACIHFADGLDEGGEVFLTEYPFP